MAKSKHVEMKNAIQAREIKIRFVYNGEVKGEWVNGLDAYQNGFIMPAGGAYKVIRVEFEGEERPPRIRQTEREVNGRID